MIDIGNYDAALRELNKYGKDLSQEQVYIKARALYGLNRIEEAQSIIAEALKVNPKEPRYYAILGLISGKGGKMKESILFFTKAIAIDKNYASAFNNRGIAYAALQKKKEAINDFTESIRIDPKYADAYRNRGIILQGEKKLEAACEDWRAAAALGQDDPRLWVANECTKR